MINYRLRNAKNLLLDKNLHIFIIIFFEFFGTALFTYCNLNLLNLKNASGDIQSKIMFGFIDFALSMLMCMSYTRQFAGGVYNPAVVVFRMLRKTDRFPIKTGLIYIVSQILGSLTGAFIASYLDNIVTAPITGYLQPEVQLRHFGTEMVGGFVLTFMVQLVTQKSMTFIDHNRQFYICLPIFYLIAKTYSKSSNCINPAFGISFQLAYCVKKDYWEPMAMSYIIIFGPTCGALVSVAMFQFVLRPLFPVKKEIASAFQAARMTRTQSEMKKIELKKIQQDLNMKNKWPMNDVMKEEAYGLMGDQFQDLFHDIIDKDIDDEIESDEDQQKPLMVYGDFPAPKIEPGPRKSELKRIAMIREQAQKQWQEQLILENIAKLALKEQSDLRKSFSLDQSKQQTMKEQSKKVQNPDESVKYSIVDNENL